VVAISHEVTRGPSGPVYEVVGADGYPLADSGKALLVQADGTVAPTVLPVPVPAGGVECLQFMVGVADQESVNFIPPFARILSCTLQVDVVYPPGARVAVGRVGASALLIDPAATDLTRLESYNFEQNTDWGPLLLRVRATVTGAPLFGSALVSVIYSVVNP
jgi:hypothetical protein